MPNERTPFVNHPAPSVTLWTRVIKQSCERVISLRRESPELDLINAGEEPESRSKDGWSLVGQIALLIERTGWVGWGRGHCYCSLHESNVLRLMGCRHCFSTGWLQTWKLLFSFWCTVIAAVSECVCVKLHDVLIVTSVNYRSLVNISDGPNVSLQPRQIVLNMHLCIMY